MVGADGQSCSFSSQRCDCCPYGYHIDLDFLQFLNSLYDAESLQKLKRFKRGANSLLSPVHSDDSLGFLSPSLERTRQTENAVLISDGDDVSPHLQILDEFDASACRTAAYSPSRLVKQKHRKDSNPAQRQPSDVATTDATVESSLCLTTLEEESIDDCSTSETNVEQLLNKSILPLGSNSADASSKESSISLENVLNVEGGKVSPTFLLAIREQLVESLRRTKELEEQVKVIPILKSRISMLKEENSLLTLTTDRTFSNAAVGDFRVFDDTGSSKPEIPPSTTGGRMTIDTSKLISSDSGKNSTEGFSAVSLKSTPLSIASLPLDSNFKTVYCCVGVRDVAKSEEDSRNVGIFSQTTTSDSCVGTDVDFVDCGTGDEVVSYDDDDDQTFNILTKQPPSPSETVADLEKSRSKRNETGENPLNASLIPSTIGNFEELESPISGVSDPKRFKSVATQCEDGDKTGRNDSIENTDFQLPLGLPSVQHLSNTRSTQTDKFLLAEYSSKSEKIGDDENVPSKEDETQVNVVKSKEISKKRISFGEVTIYETEISDDDDLIIDEDTSSSTDCETDSGLRTVESVSPDQSPMVECIVTEHLLESPQCALSVIIDDSNGSSTTSSDSEDSSALTILEVIPNGKSSSISMAVKSVDEYFDAGIVVEEDTTVGGSGTGENLSEERKNDEVVLIIKETLPTTNEDAENADKSPDKNGPSFNIDEQTTEGNQCNQHTTNSLTNNSDSASDESSVNNKTDSETFISHSSSTSKICDECSDLSSEAVIEVNAGCFPQSEFPVTDHLEAIQVQKKHPKNPDVISTIEPQVTGIPLIARAEVKSMSQMSFSDTVSNGAVSSGNSEFPNYGQFTQSSMRKKKIIITETIIERRRIDHSVFDDQTQSTENRSFGSEDLKDDHHSRRFVGLILLMYT